MRYNAKGRLVGNTIVIFIIIMLWYFMTKEQSTRDQLFFPGPALLIDTALAQGEQIVKYSVITWYRVVLGVLFGGVIGIILGFLMSYNKILLFMIDPIVEIIRPIPPIALTPFFILWFGLGDAAQLLLISLGCLMIIAISTYEGIKNVNPIYAKAGRTLGANKIQIYKNIYFPAIIPGLLSGFRVSIATAFALTVAAEYLGAQGGLGYLIRNARTILHTETIMLAAIILGVESLLTDKIVQYIFSKFTKWTAE